MIAAQFLETFKDYLPSQPPASFTVKYFEEEVERKVQETFTKTGNK
jgi:hypothetical protein